MSHNEPLIASVDYQVTQKDLANALRYPTWGDPANRKKMIFWWIGGIIAAIALTVAAYLWLGARVGPYVGAPFAIAIYWPAMLLLHVANLAKVYAKQPGALEPARMVVRPDALLVVSEKAEVRIDWHAIKDIVNTGDYTLFILGRFQVIALPWRVVESPSVAQRLSVLAREYWLAALAAPAGSHRIPDEVVETLGPEQIVVRYEQTLIGVRRLIVGQLRRKRWVLPGLLLTSVLVGVIFSFLYGMRTGVAWGFGFFFLLPGMILGSTLLNVKQAKGVLGPHTLIAAPRGYWTQAPGIASSVQQWTTLTDIGASVDHLLLYRGPDFVVGIPRHAFATVAESDRFLAQITGWRLAQLAEAGARIPA
jgi:hypothetical protein